MAYEDLGPVGRKAPPAGDATAQRRTVLALVIVVLLLAMLGATTLAIVLHHRSSASSTPVGSARYAVIFVIDGAQPSDLQRATMPNLRALQRQGTTYDEAWVGQLEPSILASNATIASGVFPREHGLIGDVWKDSKGQHADSAINPAQVRLGSLDQILESHSIKPLAAVLKERDPSAHILSVGGAGCGAASAAGTWLADYVLCPARYRHNWVATSVTGHDPPPGFLHDPAWKVPVASGKDVAARVEGWHLGQQDDWVARSAVWAIRQTRPRLTIINFPEVGLIARSAPAGRRTALLRRLMAGIDGDIGAILHELRRERIIDQTLFVITSDGGVPGPTHLVPRDSIDQAVLVAGGETIYVQAGPSAAIALRDRLQSPPVAEVLAGENRAATDAVYYKVPGASGWTYRAQYLRSNLPAGFSAAADYLLRSMVCDASADVVAVFAPATAVAGKPPPTPGTTGPGPGFQWDSQHIPLILAGHGVLPGSSSPFPARLVDILPTVATAMGLRPPYGEGVVLADGLLQPPLGAAGRQDANARWLRPMVRSLQARAHQS